MGICRTSRDIGGPAARTARTISRQCEKNTRSQVCYIRTVRRHLSWFACAWLCCQLSLLTVAPVSLCARADQASQPACTCVHADNATCPMHHPAKSPSGCNCRSNAPDSGSLAVVSLLGPVAVLPDATASRVEPQVTGSPNHQISRFTSWIAVPDGPPPRA